MSSKRRMSSEGAELLKAVEQMKGIEKGRTYTKEQLLAISTRKSVNFTQREFAKLLNFSIGTVQDCEQGGRSPRSLCVYIVEVAFQKERKTLLLWTNCADSQCRMDAYAAA